MFILYWFLGVVPLLLGALTLLDAMFEALWYDDRRRFGSKVWWLAATEESHPLKRLGSSVGVRFGVATRLAIAGTEAVIGLGLMAVGSFVLAAALWT